MRMITSHIIGCLLVISLTLATLVSTRYISDDYDIARNKRQTADMRASELLAFQEILRRLQSQSCNDFACGLIDIGRSGRRKRDAQLPFKHSQIREILRKLPNLQKEMRQ